MQLLSSNRTCFAREQNNTVDNSSCLHWFQMGSHSSLWLANMGNKLPDLGKLTLTWSAVGLLSCSCWVFSFASLQLLFYPVLQVIRDYTTPANEELSRDLVNKLKPYIRWLGTRDFPFWTSGGGKVLLMLSWVCLSSAASWLSAGPSLPAWAMPSNFLRRRSPHCQGPYEKRRWIQTYKLKLTNSDAGWYSECSMVCRVMAFFFFHFAPFPGNVIISSGWHRSLALHLANVLVFSVIAPKFIVQAYLFHFPKKCCHAQYHRVGNQSFFSYSPRDKQEI